MANNLLSEDVLRKLISPNAKALSTPKGDKMGSGVSGRDMYDPDPDSFDDIDSKFYDDVPIVTENSATSQPQIFSSNKSRNPILQEIVNHPIDVSSLDTNKANEGRLNEILSRSRSVEERLGSGNPVGAKQQSFTNSNVDYALIKTIINECLENKFKELTKDGLLIGLSKGRVKIVDNAGNVFSAKLEKIGNVKDKSGGDK